VTKIVPDSDRRVESPWRLLAVCGAVREMIMTFDGFDATILIQNGDFAASLPGLEPELAGTLQAALRDVVRTQGAAPGADEILDREVRAELTMIDLRIERGGQGGGWRAVQLYADRDLPPAGGETATTADDPAWTKDILLRASGNWVDKNGNGQWDEGEEIVVTGQEKEDELGDDSDWAYFWSGDGTGGSGDGGEGGGASLPVAKDTPCVSFAPSGVSLQDLNNLALAESIKIGAYSNQRIEYGAILYLSGGTLHSTGIFTSGMEGEIDWNLGLRNIPSGSIIVGTLHSHPDIAGITDTIPSYTNILDGTTGTDWLAYSAIVALNWHGITSDPNMLMYIYSKEDSKTHVYDKSDRNTTHPSCSLQD
jgi:hypothetical protein